jgi:hypothetical protein
MLTDDNGVYQIAIGQFQAALLTVCQLADFVCSDVPRKKGSNSSMPTRIGV